MLVIGLTGGIGSGKSTVANLFNELNVPIIDTDIIARDLVIPNSETLKQITDNFGDDIVLPTGELDRHKLADITFNDESKRLLLESILHPKIRQVMLDQIQAYNKPYVITVIPLLVETGQTDNIDRILLVDCDEDMQISRVQQRDSRSRSQIEVIIKAQASRQKRQALADDIIENTSNLYKLKEKVTKLHHKYLKLSEA